MKGSKDRKRKKKTKSVVFCCWMFDVAEVEAHVPITSGQELFEVCTARPASQLHVVLSL